MASKRDIDRVAMAAVVLGLLSFLLAFVIVRPNRIVAGTPMFAWEALSSLDFGILVFLWLSAGLAAFFVFRKELRAWIQAIAGNLILFGLFYFIGSAASGLAASGGQAVRTSIGLGAWLMLFAVQALIVSALPKIDSPLARFTLSVSGLAAIIVLTAAGGLNDISLLKEYAVARDRFSFEFSQHLLLSGAAVAAAVVAGVPLGILAFRSRIFEKPVFLIVDSVQTIPSLALFGIMIVPLSLLSQRYALLRDLGIGGIGWAPALIALALYALLPIARNTFTGLKIIDPAVIEAGRGMGMSRIQLLFSVQVPIATPVILSGIRTSMVQAIGNTTVAALIGAGGFGVFVFQGLGQAVPDLILLGAVPVILLAIVTDKIFELLMRIVSPRGIVRWERA